MRGSTRAPPWKDARQGRAPGQGRDLEDSVETKPHNDRRPKPSGPLAPITAGWVHGGSWSPEDPPRRTEGLRLPTQGAPKPDAQRPTDSPVPSPASRKSTPDPWEGGQAWGSARASPEGRRLSPAERGQSQPPPDSSRHEAPWGLPHGPPTGIFPSLTPDPALRARGRCSQPSPAPHAHAPLAGGSPQHPAQSHTWGRWAPAPR